MVTSRGAFFLGSSLIICVAMLIYGPQIGKFRYLTVPTNQGLFILDTKTQMINVCTDKNCHIVPHETSGGLMPGMQTTYGQIQMMPVNSLGIVENTSNSMGGFGCGNSVCVMPSMIAPQQPPQPIIQMQQSKPESKPVQPIAAERQPELDIQEISSPPRPVVQPFIAHPAPPVAPTPIIRQPIMPTARLNIEEEKPMSAPTIMQQKRPVEFQSAVRTVPSVNPAEQRVTDDMVRLQETEQNLLGR